MKKLSLLISLIMISMTVFSTSAEIDTNRFQSVKSKLSGAVALYIGSSQALAKNQESLIDENNPSVVPYIKNDRTLVPVRFVTEKMGASVSWEPSTKKVTIKFGEKTIEMVIGKKEVNVGGKVVVSDVAPEITNDRTFVPLRLISEGFGKKVFYDRGLVIVSDIENIFDEAADKEALDFVVTKVNNLPLVGNKQNLEKILKTEEENPANMKMKSLARAGTVTMMADMAEAASAPQMATKEASTNESGAGDDYSKTNVQVEGVDEADVVKTDGKYIYKVNPQRIVIAEAYPSDNMKVASNIKFEEQNFNPSEIYVDGDKLIVIGNTWVERGGEVIPMKDEAVKAKRIMPPYYRPQLNMTKAMIYDIKDKSKPVLSREVEIEGSYISSRKIDNSLYMVSNKWFSYYSPYNVKEETVAPMYKDSNVKDDYVEMTLDKVRYFPDSVQRNFLTIAGVDLTNNDSKANISSYLGAGDQVYASTKNLYITLSMHQYRIMPFIEPALGSPEVSILPIMPREQEDSKTVIYKFSLTNGNVTYLNKGEVPGTILNQFSMDENGDYFRIATTKGEVWASDEKNQSKNNLYILDETMKIVGQIEDMAPGERIYSVRFMGGRAYIVTFKQVDPLFVIDVSNPTAPKILGQLKIPGYSNYLHPYDENHIIGFGKDTVEGKEGMAFYTSMKMAMFDVSDVANPIEKFKELIGDRGTDSELLYNHKALLFSKEKNLLAFPVTEMKVNENSSNGFREDFPAYGMFEFQGAYVYSIDMENGFKLRGKITHLSEEDIMKSGGYGADYQKYVERILYIKDTLFTLSQKMIKANDMNDLKEKAVLDIE